MVLIPKMSALTKDTAADWGFGISLIPEVNITGQNTHISLSGSVRGGWVTKDLYPYKHACIVNSDYKGSYLIMTCSWHYFKIFY